MTLIERLEAAETGSRELAVQILTPHGATDVYIAGAAVAIATVLREAEQREAIVWEFAVARHVGGSATRDLVKATANDPEYRNRAIERAATQEED